MIYVFVRCLRTFLNSGFEFTSRVDFVSLACGDYADFSLFGRRNFQI